MPDIANCNLSNFTLTLGSRIHYFTYYGLLPIYYFLGLSTNIILLVAFYKKSKLERTYAYQVLLTISKTLEVFCFGTFLFGLHRFAGVYGDGVQWFQKQYPLMFIICKLCSWAHIHFITSSLILVVATSADRVFALCLPFRYKTINHRRHQTIAALICFILPFTTSICFTKYFKIDKKVDRYEGAEDNDYSNTSEARIFTIIGILTRLAALALLIVFNIIVVIKFRKQQMKVARMTNCDHKVEARKSVDKTLTLLNVYQSILMCANQMPHVFLHILIAIPYLCHEGVVIPLADAFIMTTDSVNIFVVMAINKKMRDMVKTGMKCTGSSGQDMNNHYGTRRNQDHEMCDIR